MSVATVVRADCRVLLPVALLEGGDRGDERMAGPGVFRGNGLYVPASRFGGGLQTNRVLLFDSVHPQRHFATCPPTFPTGVHRPRIMTGPRLFRNRFAVISCDLMISISTPCLVAQEVFRILNLFADLHDRVFELTMTRAHA